jgi:GT2 family glycosyltransferase
MRYVSSPTRGLSRARNIGIGLARSELVACTDDDCESPPQWLTRMSEALRHGENIAVVFGNLHPAPYDRAAGFTPGYSSKQSFIARSQRQTHCVDGMSGCMGLRRSAWERLGGFDEMLGAGAFFRAAEDMDFAIRALAAGFWVHVTPEVKLTHHGFRTWAEGRALVHGYLLGIGAMAAKHLKCGNLGLLRYLAQLFLRWAFARMPVKA